MTAELDTAMWHKASFSTPDNNCIEVTRPGALVGLRDTKAPQAGRLVVSAAALDALLELVKA